MKHGVRYTVGCSLLSSCVGVIMDTTVSERFFLGDDGDVSSSLTGYSPRACVMHMPCAIALQVYPPGTRGQRVLAKLGGKKLGYSRVLHLFCIISHAILNAIQMKCMGFRMLRTAVPGIYGFQYYYVKMPYNYVCRQLSGPKYSTNSECSYSTHVTSTFVLTITRVFVERVHI